MRAWELLDERIFLGSGLIHKQDLGKQVPRRPVLQEKDEAPNTETAAFCLVSENILDTMRDLVVP